MLTECGKNIEYNGETLFFTYFEPIELISIENVNSRVLRETIRKLQCARKTVGNDYICAMPMHVWVRFVSALNAVPFSRRKAIARVYIYLYYHAMSFFGSFGRSRELMITDLRVNNHTLNDALK